MKTLQKQTSRKKAIVITIVVIILLGAAAASYFYMANTQQRSASTPETPNTTSLEPATKDQIEAGNSSKQQTVDGETKPGQSNSDKPAGGGPTISVSITAANQNGSVVNIRALINELINSGTCSLKLTKGSSVITKTAAIQALASTATCQGFDVATSELPAGTWHMVLTVSSGDRSGSAEHDFSVQ